MQENVILRSELDQSVNFVTQEEEGMVEARYVRRVDDYFIVYLSSQTGCNKGCRFCHLTQTGQTFMRHVTLSEYLAQADDVLNHYDRQVNQGVTPARKVNFNFMSRGEVLANPSVLSQGDELVEALSEKAVKRGLIPSMKFSTIMPREMEDKLLTDIFSYTHPDVYYSLYSTDPSFRRRWLPNALPHQLALEKLAQYQRDTRKIPVLHWAFIEGENDSVQTIEGIIEAINAAGLRPDFNIVRYNPYSSKQGREPSEEVIHRNATLLSEGSPGSRIKVVTRVGFDVKASCGMFVPGPDKKGRVRQPLQIQ